ncbi:MAG: hypothetical protein ACRDJ2_02200 [Actinomycetota bacterium]
MRRAAACACPLAARGDVVGGGLQRGETQGSKRETEPALELTGRMLTTGGFRDPAMQIHDFAADTTERVVLPGNPEVVDAFWSESGDVA